MLPPILLFLLAAAALAAAVQLARWRVDERAAREAWNALAADAGAPVGLFEPSMVAALPEPARRFFLFAIAPGARLATVVEIRMEGELALGSKAAPNPQPMAAQQILAAPRGLVWRVRTGKGLLRACGSDGMVDGRSWTRFWLLRLVPVVRVGDTADHLRSSFGRVVAEAAFWAPAALLPRAGVTWTAVDRDTARATVCWRGLSQEVDVRVDATGQPVWVSMPRWSNANPAGVFRLQPFGGELSDFRQVDGMRVPFRVDGGNFFGTPDYFPFYRARVLAWRVL
jgi:hypothetical protein